MGLPGRVIKQGRSGGTSFKAVMTWLLPKGLCLPRDTITNGKRWLRTNSKA